MCHLWSLLLPKHSPTSLLQLLLLSCFVMPDAFLRMLQKLVPRLGCPLQEVRVRIPRTGPQSPSGLRLWLWGHVAEMQQLFNCNQQEFVAVQPQSLQLPFDFVSPIYCHFKISSSFLHTNLNVPILLQPRTSKCQSKTERIGFMVWTILNFLTWWCLFFIPNFTFGLRNHQMNTRISWNGNFGNPVEMTGTPTLPMDKFSDVAASKSSPSWLIIEVCIALGLLVAHSSQPQPIVECHSNVSHITPPQPPATPPSGHRNVYSIVVDHPVDGTFSSFLNSFFLQKKYYALFIMHFIVWPLISIRRLLYQQ